MSPRSAADLILLMYFFVAEQSCWWYFTEAIWPGAEFHRHTLNYSLVPLKAAQDCSWRCTAPVMRETDTIHWVSPLQTVPIAEQREDNAEKGLHTARVRIYTNSFQATSLNHSNSQARVDFMEVWISSSFSSLELQSCSRTLCIFLYVKHCLECNVSLPKFF